jgi:hypothetical protein
MDNQNSVFYIILGAILALATSLVVEIYKNWSTHKNLRKNFTTVLRLELKHLITIIDKLTENYSSKYFFPFGIIDQLDRNISRLEVNRKDSIYLREENKKEEILTFFNDLFVFASDLRSIENYGFNKVDDETTEATSQRLDFCKQQRSMISIRTVDLKRRAQDIINYFES